MSVSTVSATGIQDPTGQVFANGTWRLEFVPTYGTPGIYNDGGLPFTKQYGGSLDATGSFSQAGVNRNDTIAPTGSQWRFTAIPAVNGTTYSVLLNINTPAFDVTAAINAVITNIVVSPTNIARAYKDAELINVDGSGAIYYDETLKVLKVWDAVTSTFLPIIPNGGSPTFNNLIVTGQSLVKNFENVRYADQFPGVDWGAKVAAAITDLGGPGIVNASAFTTTQSLSNNLVISQAGVCIIFPPIQINQGTNRILVSAGTTGVSFIGTVPYGTANGTILAYTGASAGIDIGDSTADTSDFFMRNIRFDIGTANAAAIGLRLNRCINYCLEYCTGIGMAAANTQKLVDLEGFTNFTGGTIIGFSSNQGNSSIFFGKNANANSLFYLQLGPSVNGFGLNFDGGGVGCGGNQVFGGDIEGAGAGARFDFATDNYLVMRMEANTNSVIMTANSATNFSYTTGQELAAATDAGTGNAIGGPKGFNKRLMGTTGNSGFSWLSGTITNLIAGGANQWLYTAGLSRTGSAHIISISSAVDPNSATGDVNITRQSAGVLQIGTGETANANGTLQVLTLKTTTPQINNGIQFNGATSGATNLTPQPIAGSTSLLLPAATDTLVAKATTDILSNKTLTGTGSGNSVVLLNSQGSLAAVTGTGADAQLYTFTIPANTMQAGKGIRLTIVTQHTAGNGAVTYKLKLGATTLVSDTITSNAGVGNDDATYRIMNNAGVQNAQTWSRALMFINVGTGVTSARSGTSAENTANALALTYTMNAAGTEQVTPIQFIIEQIQ